MDHSGLIVNFSRSGDAMVMEMRGQITNSEDDALQKAFRNARDQGASQIIMDFSAVNRFTSPGASLLVKEHALARKAGQRITAVGLDDVYRRVFALTNLDRAMLVHNSLAEALAASQGGSKAGQTLPLSRNNGVSAVDEATVKQRESEAEYWARPISRIQVPAMAKEAVSLNVEARGVVGPVLGFGPMWEKTYEISFEAAKVTPATVI